MGKLKKNELVVGNYYPKYTTRNILARYLVKIFTDQLLYAFSLTNASTCIDVGTGEGVLLQRLQNYFPSVSFVASDISSKMVLNTSLLGVEKTDGVVSSIQQLPFCDNVADVVLACEVLEHIQYPECAVQEVVRVSHDFCIFSVPNEPLWRFLNVLRFSYWYDFGNTPGHIQHWSQSQFIKLISRYCEIQQVWSPLPWTVVLGRKRKF